MTSDHTSKYFAEGTSKRLGLEFFNVPCEDLAKNLLGKVLVRQLEDGSIVKGRIVETESYLGGDDAASQSYGGKITPRNEPMFMKPGTIYVYFTYGMYHCFNISSQGEGAAVLLRALEPTENIEKMLNFRKTYIKSPKTFLKTRDLCNGPAKLCISLSIDIKTCNKHNLSSWNGMWIESDSQSELAKTIVCTSRIGIHCKKEWQEKFLRFYIYDNPFVSKVEKTKMKCITFP
ncbi:DNA-3-methyladenine glycosylase-like [Daktulosphaira vitifoliae]|uniref:DNA-3-methyladenine glycosylase-like n=1 Tax=Daktulosphaira vitifoliae TaxID=58002 RepID=UPI0021AAF8BA|nr:DNA-3-methyladenine glycosylase-like [Daktulosphaira vitifoliae]XP_050541132.1 DNA-3-methyladenine glycosylase-like [Daktulosphaira vitifoliae]XP_050541134.1 DNA-3-methyladenine glycosylase-like [Daktulosphaira vitifoliae]XP_050541135.1 DNA-3-methyladenine glycosylase-like [Daktulosphaira vitifoliae]